MTYILPTVPGNASGGQPAHLNASGRPACGAPLPEKYITDEWLMAWNLCEACKRPQLSLFADAQYLFAEVQS